MRKPVRQCLRLIADLRSSIRESRDSLSRQLARRAAALSGAPAGDATIYQPILDYLDAELAAAHRELADAERAYDAAQPELPRLRRRRDAVAAELRDLAAPLPRLLRGLPGLPGAGIPVALPESPVGLADLLPDILDFLRRLERNPSPPIAGIRIDAGALAAELEPRMRRLEDCLRSVGKAGVAEDCARTLANQALARARRVATWVGLTLENLAGLAGRASR